MSSRAKRRGNGTIRSALFPFLEVRTDGRAKQRHNEEVLRVLGLLKRDGVQSYTLHHIRDAGLSSDLPIALGGKYYDIGYKSRDGEVFLVEIMRVTHRGKSNINGKNHVIGHWPVRAH